MKIWDWLREQTPAAKREKAKHQENLKRWEANRQINLNLLESIMAVAPEGAVIVVQTGEYQGRGTPAGRAEKLKSILCDLHRELGRVKCEGLDSPDIMAFFAGKVTPEEVVEELTVDSIERFWIFNQ